MSLERIMQPVILKYGDVSDKALHYYANSNCEVYVGTDKDGYSKYIISTGVRQEPGKKIYEAAAEFENLKEVEEFLEKQLDNVETVDSVKS